MNWESWRADSKHTPHARLMHSRLAYEVLEAIYHFTPDGSGGGPALEQPLNTPIAVHEY